MKNIKPDFSIVRFIYDFEDQLEDLSIQYKDALWNLYCGRETGLLKDLETRMLKVMTNAGLLETIQASEHNVDTYQRRKLFLLKTEIQRTLIEQDTDLFGKMMVLQDAWNNYTVTVHDEERNLPELNQLISEEPDDQRRFDIYKSLSQFSKTLEPVWFDLIRSRNQTAGRYGYNDYTDYKLTQIEITREQITPILEYLDHSSEAVYGGWLKELAAGDHFKIITPWNFQYIYRNYSARANHLCFATEQAQPAVWNYLESLGFRMPDTGLTTVDAGAQFPSMVIPVRIPTDVRMFICSGTGWDTLNALIREYGRAVHYGLINQSGYILKGVSPVLLNATAELFGDILFQPVMLEALGISDPQKYIRLRKVMDVIQLRMMMTLCEFELFMHTRDIPNAGEHWLAVSQKYLRFTHPQYCDWGLQQILLTRPFSALEWITAYYLKENIHAVLLQNDPSGWAEILESQLFEWGNFLRWTEINERFNKLKK
jgi:hypothetical protein